MNSIGWMRVMRHPEAAAGASAGQAGDYAAASNAAQDRLLSMMTQTGTEDGPKTQTRSAEAAHASPETPHYSTDAEDSGQNDLSSEQPTSGHETPETGASNTEARSETNENDETVHTDSTLPAEIAALSAGERSKLLTQMAEALRNGESVNSLLRGHRYATKLEAQLEELNAKVEQLQSAETSNANAQTPVALPESVAKLKSTAEVEARQRVVESRLEGVQDFLDANPGDAGTEYQVGGQTKTRQDLINWRAELRAELKALPQRASQLEKAATFAQKRREISAKVALDFPQMRDPENPDTQMARRLASDARFANEVEGDYLALALATGHRILQAQLAQKKNPAVRSQKPEANGSGNGTVNGNGAIPRGKPSVAPSAAAPRNGSVNSKALLDRARREKSEDALAALVGGMG